MFKMFNKSRFSLFLLIFFIALLLGAYWTPLFETTEARYGEISREMLASGNYMEPFYNGIKHFHKPPFTYWINALGLAIFGVNGLGARFFGAVASVIMLIYTRRTAFVLSGDNNIANRSVLVLASSILFLVVSRIVATDIYLAMFTIMTLYHMFSQMYVRKRTSNAIYAGLFLGLGFMTKGPIIFLFTLLPFFTAKIFDRDHRRVFTYPQVLYGFLVFAAISLPWYGYVVSINEGLLNYFLKDQTVERVTTNKFHRSQPIYFFFLVFFVTFLPWIFYFIRNYRFSDKLKSGRALYLYILMPFIVFEIAISKLATYILPFYPVAAVIVAVNVESRLIKRFAFGMLAVLGLGLCAAPFIKDYLKPFMFFMIPFGLGYSALAVYLFVKGYFEKYFTRIFSYMMIGLMAFIFCVFPFFAEHLKGYRLLAEDIKQYDPDGKYKVLIYAEFIPAISFYLDNVTPMAFSRTRETRFQHESDYRRFLIETDGQLLDYLKDKKDLLLVFHHDRQKGFEAKTGWICEDVTIRGWDKRVSHCKAPDKPLQ